MKISKEITFTKATTDIRAMGKNVLIKALTENRVYEIAPHIKDETDTNEKIVKVRYTTDRDCMQLGRECTIVHDYTVDSWSVYYNWLSPEIVSVHIIDCWYNSRNFLIETTPSQKKNIKKQYGQFVTTGYFKQSSDVRDLKIGIISYLDANLDINPVKDYQNFFDNFTRTDFIKATLWAHKAGLERINDNMKNHVKPDTQKLLAEQEELKQKATEYKEEIKQETDHADQYDTFKKACYESQHKEILEQYLTSIGEQLDQYKRMTKANELYKDSKGGAKRRTDIAKTKVLVSAMITDIAINFDKVDELGYKTLTLEYRINDIGSMRTKKMTADYINSLMLHFSYQNDVFCMFDGNLTANATTFRQKFICSNLKQKQVQTVARKLHEEIKQGANYFDARIVDLNI